MIKLTAEKARKLFSYDKESGLLTRRVTVGRRGEVGDVIRRSTPNGYHCVGVDWKVYQVHRVIYLIVTGAWPDKIDHINGDRKDNRWENLRSVDVATNSKNQKRYSNNKSGIQGVYLRKNAKTWIVYIGVKGNRLILGRFSSFFEACCARKSAEATHGYHENHGR